MRIAVWYNLPSGGAKRALYHHVRGLVARGHDVEVWCTPRSRDGFLPLGDGVTEHVVPVGSWWAPRAQVLHHLADYLDMRGKAAALDRHCRACAEEINAGSFDVLFANSCADTVVSAVGRYVVGPRVLYLPEPCRWLHEAAPVTPWTPPRSPRGGPRLLWHAVTSEIQRQEELELVKAYDLILVNSLYSRESLLRAYGLDSRVCYLGVDTDIFAPTDADRGNYVVGLGEIVWHKGVDRAVRAIATIDERRRPDLVWIGNRASPDYLKLIEGLAESLGVRFTPRLMVGDDELVNLLSGASAMLYTSRLEPFGFAPLEACACETPVVAIAEGGARETIVDGVNGILVDGDDPVGLGEAVTRLLDNPTLARELGRQGRQLVLEKWTWEAAVDRLEAFLIGKYRSGLMV